MNLETSSTTPKFHNYKSDYYYYLYLDKRRHAINLYNIRGYFKIALYILCRKNSIQKYRETPKFEMVKHME